MTISTIEFTTSGSVRILDQRLLPGEEAYVDLTSVEEVALAIETLAVRGAPLIGIAGAMGVALAARPGGVEVRQAVDGAVERLRATRPTAVNLNWALDRMVGVAVGTDADAMFEALLRPATSSSKSRSARRTTTERSCS